MANLQSDRKTFTKRPGTRAKGTDYEDILAAFLAFKLVNDNDVEDFNLSSNDKQYGSFDDIVIESIDVQKVSKISPIQLKHKEKIKTVTRDKLAAKTGDFSLQKYFECFKNIKKKYKLANLNCYLYTNAKFAPSYKFIFRLKDKKHIVVSARQISLLSGDLFNTSGNGFLYQFEITQDNGNDPEITEYKDFFDHFFFYSNQKNVDNIESYALDLFQKEYFCEKSCFEKYMEFISKWSKLDGKKCCLDKELVRFKIGECLLRPMAMKVSLSSGDNSKFSLLQQAFLHFDATILQTDEVLVKGSLAEIFGQISNVDTNEASRIARDFFIETRRNLPFDEFDEDQKITVLWYMNKLPLILQVDEKNNILKQAEKFCQGKKFIFIGQHIDRSNCHNLQIFQNLQDLSNDLSIYGRIVQDTKISLQGRQVKSLEDLIRNYEEIEEAFTPVDLMNTTDGFLRVGEDKEELPHPYISQFLPKYVIDFEFLKQNNSESLSVINANQKLDIIKEKISGIKLVTVEEFLKEVQNEEVEEPDDSFPNITKTYGTDKEKMKHFEQYVLVAEDQCSLEEFRRICDKSPNRSCHHFCINPDNNMELIRSNGNIEDLKKCKSVSNYISEAEIFASSNSKINVITGKPGMGKTVLLKYLKNNIPSNYWVVNISLREHFLFFREEHSNSEILNYLLKDQAKRMKYNNLAIKIRNIFQSKRNIVFLWDGLDELPNNCVNGALKAIEGFSNLGFINWITAREHLQPILEAKFKVFALTIKEMEPEEQKSYIKKRLEAKYSEEKLEDFTQKIMEAVATTDGVSFLGVPFHINILTELFLRDAEKYNNLLNSTFTQADMIQHSVEEKFDFYYKEKCKYEDTNLALGKILKEHRENRISLYELVALKTFLSAEDIVGRLHINCQQHLNNIKFKLSEDDFGIIAGVNVDDSAIFIHNIYGEYFVASWMSKNLELVQTFKDFFFEETYKSIRLMFDLILAKNCPAHLAVLHNNFSSLYKNNNEIKRRDKGGRSPLHLACSWGEKRPVLPVEKEEDLLVIDDSEAKAIKEDSPQYRKILNFLIERKKCDSFEKDHLFHWDCIEYATDALCLLAVEEIAGNQNLEVSSLQKYNDCTIWYYGIRFGYTNLLEKKETVPYIELKGNRNNLLHEAVSYGRNEYLEKLFTNPFYLQHIDKENNDRLLVSRNESTSPQLSFKIPASLPSLLRANEFTFIKQNDGFINVYNVSKQAPLHIAATHGNSEAINILLARGAAINILTNCKENALYLATMNQHLDAVKLLMKNGASINEINDKGENILHIAAQTGNCELIEYLLRQNVPLTCNKHTVSPLHYVVLFNHMDALKIMLKRINLLSNRERMSLVFDLFMNAVRLGRTEMVKHFVRKYGIDVNATDLNIKCTPLQQAAFYGHIDITNFLIEKKANINVGDTNGVTPLHLAVGNGHTKIVQLLIQKEVDLNQTDNQGCTPLHYAVELGTLEAARILIENNARKNLCDRFGRTPLFIAAIRNKLRVMEMLLEAGADGSQTDVIGMSVLMASIYFKQKEAYVFLIKNCEKYGLNLDLRNDNGYTALYVAVQEGDQHATNLLLENGASTTVKYSNNINIVYLAAQVGNVEILKLLIKHGVDINLPDQNMRTPLHTAAQFGRTDCVRILVQKKVDLNQTCNKGGTPLHYAVGCGMLEVVQILIENNANINLSDRFGRTPLYIAAIRNELRITEMLLEAGADGNITNIKGNSVLIASLHLKQKEVYEFLIKNCKKYGLDLDLLNNDGINALYLAVQRGDKHATKLLLENGTSTTVKFPDNSNIVRIAAAIGNVDILKFLIKHGVDINLPDENMATPLHYAAQFGRTDCVRILVQKKVDLNQTCNEGGTPLHYAVPYGMLEVAQILIESNANINLRDRLGRTPLYIAAIRNELRIMEMLLEAGADSNQTDIDGNSVLIASLHLKQKEVYKFLIKNCKKYGLDLDLQNNNGGSALYLAVQEEDQHVTKLLLENGASTTVKFPDNSIVRIAAAIGNVDILKLLLKHDADINLPDQYMVTPLHLAATFGRTDCARILLQKGADPSAKDSFGQTPRQIAEEIGYHDLCQLIDSFMGLLLLIKYLLENPYLLHT